ncbi:hypothetical protein PFISCL1PPCAC_16059, partial [Pristionchus fissidentatus]
VPDGTTELRLGSVVLQLSFLGAYRSAHSEVEEVDDVVFPVFLPPRREIGWLDVTMEEVHLMEISYRSQSLLCDSTSSADSEAVVGLFVHDREQILTNLFHGNEGESIFVDSSVTILREVRRSRVTRSFHRSEFHVETSSLDVHRLALHCHRLIVLDTVHLVDGSECAGTELLLNLIVHDLLLTLKIRLL